MRRSRGGWLLRGLAVIALTLLVMLGVLVSPLSEPPFRAPVPDTVDPPASGEAGEFTPTPQPGATPTLVAIPTITPLFTRRPTDTPVPSVTLTSTPTPTPSPTDTPAPTPVLSPLPSHLATATAGELDHEWAGRVEQHTYFSQVAGAEQSYRVYLPPGYAQTDRRYSVLYLLHGWPYEAADWERVGVNEAADRAIQTGALPPFLVVLPKGTEGLYVDTAGGNHSFEGQLLTDLIPHVDATYRTRAEREGRAIGGISRGGVWALEISFRHPDLFAVVGAHSPALSANRAPPVYDPFYLLESPGVAGLRIYLSAGDKDWAWKTTKELHEALDKQGISSDFALHDGVHRYALWSEHLEEYLAFYAAEW